MSHASNNASNDDASSKADGGGAPGEQDRAPRKAGAFDIRVFIASLIGIYGVVVVLTGFFGTTEADLQRAGGLNINLLAGAGMVVAALAFLLWARLRPVVVAPAPDEETDAS